MLAWEDDTLTNYEKKITTLDNLYLEVFDDADGALKQALKFLNGGRTEVPDDDNPLRLYSFDKDAQFIFSAFRSTHGIDLATADLHWWTFLALFMDLGSETTWCRNILAVRQAVLTGTATKEQLQAYNEHPEIYELSEPDDRSPEENEISDTFDRLYQEGRKKP